MYGIEETVLSTLQSLITFIQRSDKLKHGNKVKVDSNTLVHSFARFTSYIACKKIKRNMKITEFMNTGHTKTITVHTEDVTYKRNINDLTSSTNSS